MSYCTHSDVRQVVEYLAHGFLWLKARFKC